MHTPLTVLILIGDMLPPARNIGMTTARRACRHAHSARYSGTAVALHWVLAVVILASLALGSYMTSLPLSPLRLRLVNWHKWAGMLILGLSAARLLWRAAHRPPADLPTPAWQRHAAHATHGLLYVLCIVVPIAGWAYSSAAGFPVVLFGVWPLPDLVEPDRALADVIKPWHGRLAWMLAGVIGLHVGAALKHHFIDRDMLLSRMWIRIR